jgi:hypothetical protein
VVQQQDDAVAEGARVDQAQIAAGVRGREQRPAAAEHHGVDVEPVLVDEVRPPERGGELRPAERQVTPARAASSWTSAGTTSRTIVVFQPAACSVRE